jgi:hypothetical protein
MRRRAVALRNVGSAGARLSARGVLLVIIITGPIGGTGEERMDDEQGRRDILDEQLLSQLQAIQESLRELPKINERLGRVESDVQAIKGDLVVVKALVTDHSADLAELKHIVAGHMETMTALQLASHSH